jgi:hypothetical protein
MEQKNRKTGCFFSLYYLLPDLMCYIPLHSFHISSKLLLSNGTKNMRLLNSVGIGSMACLFFSLFYNLGTKHKGGNGCLNMIPNQRQR